MDLGLKGKTALVTGANRGTGAAIATRLAEEGASVLVHRLDRGAPDPTTERLVGQGLAAHSIAGDITTDEGAAEAYEATLGGPVVDILINNYGLAERGNWEDTDADQWIAVYQRNVLTARRMIGHFANGMRNKGWGRIVQIGTIGSFRPNARMPHYYVAKSALAAMTVSLAKELGGTGITVNTISPGLIKTAEVEAQFRARAQKKGWGDEWAEIERHAVLEFSANPTARIALPEEVGDLVAFVASDRAAYINGENIRIDGGAVDLPF
jgi:3-oxoacyl-[acyl-carrier protein] reductase